MRFVSFVVYAKPVPLPDLLFGHGVRFGVLPLSIANVLDESSQVPHFGVLRRIEPVKLFLRVKVVVTCERGRNPAWE